MDTYRKKRKKRKYHHYYLNVTSNPSKPARSSRLSSGSRTFWIVIVSLIIIVLFAFMAYENYVSSVAKNMENGLRQQIVDLNNEKNELILANQDLEKEKEELQEKINILSETVNQKLEVEQQFEEKSIPSGFPMSSAADYESKDEELRMDGQTIKRPMLVFAASDGSYAVASGNGVVKLADKETSYGYEVLVDHGNGYVSSYRTNTKPKVKQGDEVTRGAILFEMDSDDDDMAKMAYQIILDGEYVNPGDYLEISG